jgi:hypothetical protein
MIFYSCNDGRRKAVEFLIERGMGRLITPGAWKTPVPGLRWCLDNGAYGSWKANRPWSSDPLLREMSKIPSDQPPDFITCPDKPAAGLDSLKFSLKWIKKLPPDYDYYLAVQDGMQESDVIPALNGFAGLFVGGTKKWKLKTLEQWTNLAHRHDIQCHVGRISSLKHLLYCQRVNVDSVDSSTLAQQSGGWRVSKILYARIDALLTQTRLDV